MNSDPKQTARIAAVYIAICMMPAAWLMASANGAQRRPNVLLICVDDLRPELACFGAHHIHSPNIDSLANQGRVFLRHYVQAPTCGASRYSLLTGRYGAPGNHALFQRAENLRNGPESVPPSLPAYFRAHGYTTVAVGKVSHHPGGLGGLRWNDPTKLEMPNSWDRQRLPVGDWGDPRGWMHGLANGEVRTDAVKPAGSVEMDVFQAIAGPDSIYPDGDSISEAIRQLEELASAERAFFLAVGILRPHLPFGAPAKYLRLYDGVGFPDTPHPKMPKGRTTWHRSGEFMKYNRWDRDPNMDPQFALAVRRHYAACVSFADAQVGRLITRLTESGASDHTIVVLWGDHGWHLGEHGVWGKHTLFEESLRSPLVILNPGIKSPGAATHAIVETLDLFPTLCELVGLPIPDFVQGTSLCPILNDPNSSGHAAVSYHRKATSIRTATHRLVLHDDGFVELYDHRDRFAETRNVADSHATLVQQLTRQLHARLRPDAHSPN